MMHTSILALLPVLVAAAPLVADRDTTPTSPPGCTKKSINDFEWQITGFEFHASYTFSTPAHQNAYGYANFNISNPATESQLMCNAISTQLQDFFYGNQIFQCYQQPGYIEAGTPFTYAWPSNELALNQTWTCDDQDPAYPFEFNAIGSTTLSLDCQTTDYQNTNWTMGEIYSEKEIKCTPIDFAFKPSSMTGITA